MATVYDPNYEDTKNIRNITHDATNEMRNEINHLKEDGMIFEVDKRRSLYRLMRLISLLRNVRYASTEESEECIKNYVNELELEISRSIAPSRYTLSEVHEFELDRASKLLFKAIMQLEHEDYITRQIALYASYGLYLLNRYILCCITLRHSAGF